MLKRKFKQTGFVIQVLLLLTGFVTMSATHRQTFGFTLSADTTSNEPLYFDTLSLKLCGSSEMQDLNAPRLTMNAQSRKFVTAYLANADNRETLEMIRKKSRTIFPIIDEVFDKYGIPREMKYLAVVESELKTTALSHVGARGIWQLMPETARLLSLKVSARYDERTHVYKSTVAVAKYLRDLYRMYNDWPLVIAAYNSGPGKVFQAIRNSGSRNFWKMQSFLPAETRGHVKRFIATHYYFEGDGGVTTLTKSELASYRKTMLAFVDEYNTALATTISDSTSPANDPVPADVVICDPVTAVLPGGREK